MIGGMFRVYFAPGRPLPMPMISSGKVARLPLAVGVCSAQGPGLGKKSA